MSIQLKSVIKPLFVNGATPDGDAFGNWIDSCVFLIGNDSTIELNTINEKTVGNGVVVAGTRMIGGRVSLLAQASPTAPTLTETLLFANSAKSNRLYTKDNGGNTKPVTPTQYISVPFDSNTTGSYVFMNKKAIKILSARASIIGTGDLTVGISHAGNNSSVSSTVTVVDEATTALSTTNYTLRTFTILEDSVAAERIFNVGVLVENGTIAGVISIEYEEVE